MIELQAAHLGKKFGDSIVFRDITFSVHSPEVIGIAGPNGSGKSTLLKCLTRLTAPSKGTISWKRDDTELDSKQLRAILGYAAPYLSYYSELSVLENLEFLVAHQYKLSFDIESLADFFQLTDLLHQPYGSLSSGQQQRCKLTASVVRRPEVLILDEPGTNLDSSGNEIVRKMVDESRNQGRLTILASNAENELDLCDRIISVS